jgi:hypothetical protein
MTRSATRSTGASLVSPRPPSTWHLLVNQALYAQGLHAAQALGVFFDGIARHTEEAMRSRGRAAETGFKQAVRERDAPYEG